jgi:hypothetical protein
MIPKSQRPQPRQLLWVDKSDDSLCSGCGIPLQTADPSKPGYVYNKTAATKDRARAWEAKYSNQVFDRVLRESNESIREMLINVENEVKELDLKKGEFAEELGEQRDPSSTEKYEPEIGPLGIPPERNYLSKRPMLCRRCHELTYHSNPLKNQESGLPPPPHIEEILTNIMRSNLAISDPPLLVHVIDVVDFPASFIPFQVPSHVKVLYVINRVDTICERSRSMAHVRKYFENNIPIILEEKGIFKQKYEIHTVSARKGYGIKELTQRIFALRNEYSNVYFLGTPILLYQRD